ncbi:Sec-independent protein translocase protein TatB [Paragemmobacter ruber]|uniref:Twin-arginine translocase subunit TatB n=1 Tax=Paragemmobacter ruber TaxID=1985673 RepID=A0ABW9YAW8_9RHOB|nr:Sec-independent protein translocase protein TatB [Rhodobacter ruber]NBE08962.1 twin-arginine translocase subunit TatB [Rhodobacter ruber]
MEIGWTELMVIGVVALIVIGPKDLPEMFRTLGRFTAKARAMARDFSRAMEQAARETGVDEVAKDLKTVASPKSMGLEAVKSAADKFEKWDPLKNAARPTSPTPPRAPLTPPPMPATPAQTAAATPTQAAEAVAAPAMGPATAALAEQQAQRKAIAQEAAEKLRAVGQPPAPAATPAAPPPARKETGDGILGDLTGEE